MSTLTVTTTNTWSIQGVLDVMVRFVLVDPRHVLPSNGNAEMSASSTSLAARHRINIDTTSSLDCDGLWTKERHANCGESDWQGDNNKMIWPSTLPKSWRNIYRRTTHFVIVRLCFLNWRIVSAGKASSAHASRHKRCKGKQWWWAHEGEYCKKDETVNARIAK